MTDKELEAVVQNFSDFEELLELCDISPVEAFIHLYECGMINEDLLEELRSI